jgi:preprotein translocase subunit SecD
MNKSYKSLIFIAIVTIISSLISLPNNLRLKFQIGSIKIDRIINPPKIDFGIGRFIIKKNFESRFGLDLSGGTHIVLEADMNGIDQQNKEQAFQSAKDVVEKRINLFGLTEPIIQQAKTADDYRINVEIPGISDLGSAVELIGKTAQLNFYEESSIAAQIATPSSYFDIWSIKTNLSGKHLKKSEVVFDQNTGKPQVSLEFDTQGSQIFNEITKRNIGKSVAIFLDDQLLSAPRVNEPIEGGRAVIQGDFSANDAKKLTISLNAGALPVPLKIIEQRNIGATLGNQSIEKSMIAGGIGLLIVSVFMLINYGMFGLVANIALMIYAVIVLAIFKTIPVTITLAGLAGFVLSIGMAVDANILIFERIKEEIRWGRDKKTAIDLGFDRAFSSIRDSNLSSLITCLILYYFGTGIVRGFAITLAIGIFISLFTAITVTRTFLKLIYK